MCHKCQAVKCVQVNHRQIIGEPLEPSVRTSLPLFYIQLKQMKAFASFKTKTGGQWWEFIGDRCIL